MKFNQSAEPSVHISYEEADHAHRIRVADNGIGIQEEYHDKVFGMFKRLNNREDYKGSGIGLAIVKLMVDKLRGQIKIESQAGKGSTFIIELPK